MIGFYVRDSNGNTWIVSADVDGRLTSTSLGIGQSPPPLVRLNNVPVTTTDDSWLIGVDPDGTITATAITYSAIYPFTISLNATFGWWLEVEPDGRLMAVGGASGCTSDLPSVPGNPYIVYPSIVTGLAQGISSPLYLLHPFTKVPLTVLESKRHDNRASSGVQEVIFERVDEFTEGEFKYLARGSDAINWRAFINVAITGVVFDYHPTGDPTVYTTYFLEDADWKPVYRVPGFYSFNMRFYQRVSWP